VDASEDEDDAPLSSIVAKKPKSSPAKKPVAKVQDEDEDDDEPSKTARSTQPPALLAVHLMKLNRDLDALAAEK